MNPPQLSYRESAREPEIKIPLSIKEKIKESALASFISGLIFLGTIIGGLWLLGRIIYFFSNRTYYFDSASPHADCIFAGLIAAFFITVCGLLTLMFGELVKTLILKIFK